MKADLHVHTKEGSLCGKSPAAGQIQAAVEAGLGVIAFTDHGRLQPAGEVARLNAEHAPFRILEGIELTVDGEDLIVIGVSDPLVATEKWDYPGLRTFVKQAGGFIAVAHPFRYHPDIAIPIRDFPPDAIEVCSKNTPIQAADRIVELARLLDIPLLCNSDAHSVQSLGSHYNVLDREPAGDAELMDLLRNGLFTAVAREADGTTRAFPRRGAPPCPAPASC